MLIPMQDHPASTKYMYAMHVHKACYNSLPLPFSNLSLWFFGQVIIIFLSILKLTASQR